MPWGVGEGKRAAAFFLVLLPQVGETILVEGEGCELKTPRPSKAAGQLPAPLPPDQLVVASREGT